MENFCINACRRANCRSEATCTDTVCALFARARSREIRHSCASVGHWDLMRVCTVPEDAVGAETAQPAKRCAATVPG